MKKIIIAGGSGFLGQLLADYFTQQNTEVVILTRMHREDQHLIRYTKWDGKTIGYWITELEGAEAVINLNGKSVDCRYTTANKQEIYDTRLNATNVLGLAISQCKKPPKVWINASSATIYRHAEDRDMDEATGELGEGFSVDVCKKWERVFFNSATPNVRKVALRIATVLGKDGGALKPLKHLVKFGLGGKQGSGKQYFSWVHEQDFVRVVDWVLNNQQAEGVYNVSSLNPLTNQDFMKALRKVMNIPFGMPSPKWMLELGARMIGTETELILKSRRVVPTRLQEEGFVFHFFVMDKVMQLLIKPI